MFDRAGFQACRQNGGFGIGERAIGSPRIPCSSHISAPFPIALHTGRACSLAERLRSIGPDACVRRQSGRFRLDSDLVETPPEKATFRRNAPVQLNGVGYIARGGRSRGWETASLVDLYVTLVHRRGCLHWPGDIDMSGHPKRLVIHQFTMRK